MRRGVSNAMVDATKLPKHMHHTVEVQVWISDTLRGIFSTRNYETTMYDEEVE